MKLKGIIHLQEHLYKDLKFFVYRSKGECKGQILLLHGICEYSGRYKNLAKIISEAGFDCTMIDHPGHGSHLNSDALHFQNAFYKRNKSLTLDEIISFQKNFLEFLLSEKIFSRNIPLFLFGQSMGGLTAAIISEKISHVSGTILLSPAFQAIAQAKTGKGFFDNLRYRLESSILEKSDESFNGNTLFKNTILKPMLAINPGTDCFWAGDYISDIPEENEKFKNDPMIGRKLSLRFLHSIQEKMYYCRSKKETFPCPVFLCYGGEDKIVSSTGSDIFAENRLHGEQNKIIKMTAFGAHEIHNSSRAPQLLESLFEWLNKQN